MKDPTGKFEHHCRWCGRTYYADRPTDRDGFHSEACKQAHYRAYKKYVTARAAGPAAAGRRAVTQKKRRKRGT